MQENKFEKQVQQKLEELRINPSGEVWKNVEAIIGKKKRDRHLVYLFSMLFILVATGSLIWMNMEKSTGTIAKSNGVESTVAKNEGEKNTESDKLINPSQPGISVNPVNNDAAITEPLNSADKNSKSANETIKQINDEEHEVANDLMFKGSDKKFAKQNDKKHITGKLTYKKASRTMVSVSGGTAEEPGEESVSTDKTYEKVNNAEKVSTDNSPQVLILSTDNNDTTSLVKKINTQADSATVIAKITDTNNVKEQPATAAKKSITSKQKKDWQFGLNVSLGISATRNGYLGIIGQSQSDENKDFSQALPATGSGTGNAGIPNSYSPSVVRIDKAFTAGIYTQKSIGKKAALLIGLDYKSYSTRMQLGTRVETYNNTNLTSLYYYQSGNSITYKNKYHFIELPVGVLFNLSKKQRALPVYLYAGVSVSQLINSNALQFNGSTGNYFSDNKTFHKTQVDISAKLLFSLQKSNPHSLLIGPGFSYALTRMADMGLYNNRHYSYFGLQVQKLIGKK